jgi:hypothetical protein
MIPPSQSSRTDHFARACGAIAFAGVAAFAIVCVAVQGLRADLDWIASPLSYYLTGAYGVPVQAVYVALSAALAALGVGFHRGLSREARSAAPLLLFAVAAVALTVTAASEAAKSHGEREFWALVHGTAAQTTFLCVTVAMILQSLRMRLDARWRRRFVPALVLACVAFAALWLHVLDRALPRGLSQKTVIALIVLWLGWASFALWRMPAGRSETARSR